MALHPNSVGTQLMADVDNLGGSMGIPAGTVGEVRATGNDANGGLFYAAQPSAGTDYSQQDAAQLTLVDVVTNGTSTVTSVTGGFTAAMIGNGINIAGTSYMIATRADTNTITVDRTIGANVGLGAKVGGAWATPGYASGQLVTACTCYIKAGAYSITSGTANVSGGFVNSPGGSAGFPFLWQGYQTTRGDLGTKPVITDSGVGAVGSIFTQSATFCIFDNLAIVDAGGNQCIRLQQASTRAIRCKVTASATGIGFYITADKTSCLFCEGVGGSPFYLAGVATCVGCYAHGAIATPGFFVTGSNSVIFQNCIAYLNALQGFDGGGALQCVFNNCTADANTGDGFALSSAGAAVGYHALNCVSTNNGGYGFNSAAAAGFAQLINCATFNNTSGATHFLTLTQGLVVLTGSPYTSAGSNFGLNSTAGAGAACRGAGYPGAFPGLASTVASPDIGAVQSAASGGSSGMLYVPNLAGV